MQEVCLRPQVIFLLAAPFARPATGLTQAPGQPQIEAATVCRDVVNRDSVDAGRKFPLSGAKLACFAKVIGVEGSSEITHLWSPGDKECSRINPAVNGPIWRTLSTKAIRAGETTDSWRVDVRDSAGTVLKTVPF